MKVAVAVAVLLLAGCPKPVPPPNLDGTWPAKAGDYQTTVASWTRSGEINANYQLIMRAHATILSPEWRAALVEHDRFGRGRAQVDPDVAPHRAAPAASAPRGRRPERWASIWK